MKQVVSGAFTGAFDETVEDEIISLLITESRETFKDPNLNPAEQVVILDKSVGRLLSRVKILLESRLDVYLTSISLKLLDEMTNLRWDTQMNNCQNFCDALVDINAFGSLMAPRTRPSYPPSYNPPPYSDEEHDVPTVKKEYSKPSTSPHPQPLYLMSFVCRPGNYYKPDSDNKYEYWNPSPVRSKYDVPCGLTEEYLLRFRYGQHSNSDIIDTQQEYWNDWGAFGGSLYKYQDLFPWDCTEAYGRGGVKCGGSQYKGDGEGCNLSKHVWSFPFDAHGIISLHLTRCPGLYPQPSDLPSVPSDEAWMRNRLSILLAQDSLLAGTLAMYRTPAFLASTAWLSPSTQPDIRLDRIKLGGIHRAQPYSHHFELGTYHDYFIAEWAYKPRSEQIAAYEALRDDRMRLPDVRLPYRVHDETLDGLEFWAVAVLSAGLWSLAPGGYYGLWGR
jgi:hypothetical protein